jgi:tetratricopeptide (TPR) repeat protein
LLVAFLATKSHEQQWSVAFYFLALLFNYPHFMATVYRAYHSRDQFEKYRIFTIHITLLLALAGALTHTLPAMLPWLFTLYICWSPWHYSGQNFGLLMMFSRRAGLEPQKGERRALYWAFVASFVLLMLSFHTGSSTDEIILSLNIPARWALWPKVACAVAFLALGGWALARWARRAAARTLLAAPFILFLSQFLWFVLPVGLEITRGLQVPQTRYSSGILAVLHSTQYIWITSYYQRRESRAGGRDWRLGAYFTTLVAGGIALFIPGPWIVSWLFHVDFAASFLTFTALVNIHHFILDGAIWKLRDSRVAALLLGKNEPAAVPGAASASAAGSLLSAARWFAGPSRGARVVRVGAALLLCAFGLLDQARFYWASQSGSLPKLQRAENLMPYDSSLLVRIAQADARANSPAALAALTEAARLHPNSRPVQHELAKALLASGKFAEAYQVYQKLLARYPNDVDALVNAGLLAVQQGHRDEALDDWRRAVALDPAQANAELYLGDALTARGEQEAAARHYRAYLQIVAAHPAEHAAETTEQLGAEIKVADADARAGHAADAALGYDVAIHLAEREKQPALESRALAHRAELEAQQGHPERAAASMQRALALEPSVTDRAELAADWGEYGQLIRAQGLPERFSYACYLRGEQVLSAADLQGEELRAITALRAESEVRLGGQAAAVKRDLDAVLRDALAVPPAQFARK